MRRVWFLSWSASSALRSKEPRKATVGHFAWSRYTAALGIFPGTPLRDGFHFAQTQINDFGRPYGGGWNNVTGFATSATAGRWVGFFRGEWQNSAGLPALPLAARDTIRQVDHLPLAPPGTVQPSVSQFEVLDAYVGLMFSNWQVSFGRQSLWWGPGDRRADDAQR